VTESFRVLTSPAFEREFRKISKGNPALIEAFEELLAILQEDPQNRTARHKIKKLVGLAPGEGQWRPLERIPVKVRYFWPRCRVALVPAPSRSVLRWSRTDWHKPARLTSAAACTSTESGRSR